MKCLYVQQWKRLSTVAHIGLCYFGEQRNEHNTWAVSVKFLLAKRVTVNLSEQRKSSVPLKVFRRCEFVEAKPERSVSAANDASRERRLAAT